MRGFEEINIASHLDAQNTNQEINDRGWRNNKINSMTIYFYKTN